MKDKLIAFFNAIKNSVYFKFVIKVLITLLLLFCIYLMFKYL